MLDVLVNGNKTSILSYTYDYKSGSESLSGESGGETIDLSR